MAEIWRRVWECFLYHLRPALLLCFLNNVLNSQILIKKVTDSDTFCLSFKAKLPKCGYNDLIYIQGLEGWYSSPTPLQLGLCVIWALTVRLLCESAGREPWQGASFPASFLCRQDGPFLHPSSAGKLWFWGCSNASTAWFCNFPIMAETAAPRWLVLADIWDLWSWKST